MKKLVFVCVVAILSNLAYAQDTYQSNTTTMNKKIHWSVGVDPSVPVGNFHSFSSFGLGASFQGEFRPKKVGLTLSIGYIDYFGKTVDSIEYADFKYWPLMGGLKVFLGQKTFLHGQLGSGFGTNGLGTSFWYGAALGFDLSRAITTEFKYMGWNQEHITSKATGGSYGGGGSGGGGGGGGGGYGGHYSTLGLRLAYNF